MPNWRWIGIPQHSKAQGMVIPGPPPEKRSEIAEFFPHRGGTLERKPVVPPLYFAGQGQPNKKRRRDRNRDRDRVWSQMSARSPEIAMLAALNLRPIGVRLLAHSQDCPMAVNRTD